MEGSEMNHLYLRGVLPEGSHRTYVSYVNQEPGTRYRYIELIDIVVKSRGHDKNPLGATLVCDTSETYGTYFKDVYTSSFEVLTEKLNRVSSELLKRNSTQMKSVRSTHGAFPRLRVENTGGGKRVVVTLPPRTGVYTPNTRLPFLLMNLRGGLSGWTMGTTAVHGMYNISETETLRFAGDALQHGSIADAIRNKTIVEIETISDQEIAYARGQEMHLYFLRDSKDLIVSHAVEPPPHDIASATESCLLVLGPLLEVLESKAELLRGTLAAEPTGETLIAVSSDGFKCTLTLEAETAGAIGLKRERKSLRFEDSNPHLLLSHMFPKGNALREKLPVIVTSESALANSYMSGLGTVPSLAYIGTENDMHPAPIRMEMANGRVDIALLQPDHTPLTFSQDMDICVTFRVIKSQ